MHGYYYKSRDNPSRSCLLYLSYSFACTRSRLNYCIASWCTTNVTVLDSLQRCCNKITVWASVAVQSQQSLKLGWFGKQFEIFKITDLHKLKVCSFVHKFFHNMLSKCFKKSTKLNSEVYSRLTRRTNQIHIYLIKSRFIVNPYCTPVLNTRTICQRESKVPAAWRDFG